MQSQNSRDNTESLDYRVSEQLSNVLKSVPAISDIVMDFNAGEHAADFIVRANVARAAWEIVVEISKTGQPRIVRNAVAVWEQRSRRNNLKNSYFVFAAPFIGPKAQEICKDAGVGFSDLAGNCRLAFDNIFIERIGHTAEPEKRLLRSLFYAKSSRVIRRLLTDPEHPWHVHELATMTDVSTGLVSQIKTKLIDSELAHRRGDMFVLNNPEELLQRWAAAYQFDKHEQLQFYSSKSLPELEQQIADCCASEAIEYAFTLFSGAGLIGAQYVRVVNRASAYVSVDLQSVAQKLGLKRVETGGNLILLRPADSDVFFGKRLVRERWVVSDIQLFLDFSAQRGRAQETADFILDSTIRKSWGRQ